MKNRRLKIILAAVPVILLIPLIAMQFTDEVIWTGIDFILMGILLVSAGILCEIVLTQLDFFAPNFNNTKIFKFYNYLIISTC